MKATAAAVGGSESLQLRNLVARCLLLQANGLEVPPPARLQAVNVRNSGPNLCAAVIVEVEGDLRVGELFLAAVLHRPGHIEADPVPGGTYRLPQEDEAIHLVLVFGLLRGRGSRLAFFLSPLPGAGLLLGLLLRSLLVTLLLHRAVDLLCRLSLVLDVELLGEALLDPLTGLILITLFRLKLDDPLDMG